MSTIIGIIDNGKIWMGSDSYATTADGERRRILNRKMFYNAPYLIGHVGGIRAGQVIRSEYFDPPENIFEFPDKLREQMNNKGCLATNPDDHTSMQSSNFLIANQNGQLFEILSDFQINEVVDFVAIGSGSPYALGSLWTTRSWSDSKRRIIAALKAATTYDMSTGPPYIIEEFLE